MTAEKQTFLKFDVFIHEHKIIFFIFLIIFATMASIANLIKRAHWNLLCQILLSFSNFYTPVSYSFIKTTGDTMKLQFDWRQNQRLTNTLLATKRPYIYSLLAQRLGNHCFFLS